jgi:hypothetical protein
MSHKPVQLWGLSKKADESIRNYKMRHNATATLAALPSKLGDKNPPRYVTGGFKALPKKPHQAEPVNRVAVTRAGSYRTGDGDTNTAMRPGADDHKKYKSLTSEGHAIYSKGHV